MSPGAREPLSACSRPGEMGGASLAGSVLEAVMPARCSPLAGLRAGTWSPWSLCWYFVLLSREVSLSQNSITLLPPESSEREHAADSAARASCGGGWASVAPTLSFAQRGSGSSPAPLHGQPWGARWPPSRPLWLFVASVVLSRRHLASRLVLEGHTCARAIPGGEF